ncbi:uncharacterized protein METZ01_LOCUS149254 [marine metagenome]|uniref:Uncharacterized protein n=1 Tax=marine metagenome TaxID=408172 RepID=A0A382A4E2_9ZZZZ
MKFSTQPKYLYHIVITQQADFVAT